MFRKREAGEVARDRQWETTTPRVIDGEKVSVNAYFDDHPAHILGDLAVRSGAYGSASLHVDSSDLSSVDVVLRTALDGVVDRAIERGQTMTQPTAAVETARTAFVETDTAVWDGTLLATDAGIMRVRGGRREPVKVAAKNVRELTALIKIRDAVTTVLDLEASSPDDTDDLVAAREDLRDRYDAYAAQYGPINRFTLSKSDSRITPQAPRLMRGDPFGPAVLALELFDEESQTARHAAILGQRVLSPRPVREGAETPAEAISISRDRTGRIDLDTIAYLLGTDQVDARAQLGTLVFDDPARDGQIVAASEYLSGNVRLKLDQARAANETDPGRYSTNIAALEDALPEAIPQDQIEAQLGAVWIDIPRISSSSARRSKTGTSRSNLPPRKVEGNGNKHTLRAREEWGTDDRSAIAIAENLLEQMPITVKDQIDVGETTKRVINAEKTTAAQEKAQKLQERFSEWAWEDPDRAARLSDEYNRRFNSIVLRSYDRDGEYLTLPGLTETFKPREHQLAAVARIVSEQAVGLFIRSEQVRRPRWSWARWSLSAWAS
ncbi:hypothetical protein ACFOEP_13180 [Microbacterium amylolyticum]|uniref:hypothetical protein n=1 Tax=Microbacterium amylolyticum TaxID=936337 RepID=UPI00360B9B16